MGITSVSRYHNRHQQAGRAPLRGSEGERADPPGVGAEVHHGEAPGAGQSEHHTGAGAAARHQDRPRGNATGSSCANNGKDALNTPDVCTCTYPS
eukprot:5090079-Pyramimonas_sp.AAC.1